MAGYTFQYGTGGEKGRITAAYGEVRKPAVRIPFRYTAANHGRFPIRYQKIDGTRPIKYGFVYTTANTFHFCYPAESGTSFGIEYRFRVGILPVHCYRFQYGQGYGSLYIDQTAAAFMKPLRRSIKEQAAMAFPLLARQIMLAAKDVLMPEQMREMEEKMKTVDLPLLNRETAPAAGTVDFSLLIRELGSTKDAKTIDFPLTVREVAKAESMIEFALLIRELAQKEQTTDFSLLIREIGAAAGTQDFSLLIREIAKAEQTQDFSFLIREIAQTEGTEDFSLLIREIANAEKTRNFSFLIRETATAEHTADFSFLIREIDGAETTKDFSFLIREIADAARTKDFSFLIREIGDAARTQDFSFLIREIARAETTKNFSFLIREIASAIGTLDFSFIIRELSKPEGTENFSFLIREIAKAEDTQNFSFLIREAADAAFVLAFAFIIREILKEEGTRGFVMSAREGATGHEQSGSVKPHSVYEEALEPPAVLTDKMVQKEPEEQQIERTIWKAGDRTVIEQLTAILRKHEQIWIEDSQTLQKEKEAETEQSISAAQEHDMAAALIKELQPERHTDIAEGVQLDAEKESMLSDGSSMETLPEWIEQSEPILTEILQKRIVLLPGLITALKQRKETAIDDGVQLKRSVPIKNGYQEQSEQLIEKREKYGQITDNWQLQKAQDGGQEELEQVWEKKEKEHQAGIQTIEMEKLPDTAQNEDAEQILEKAEKEGATEQAEQQSFPDHRVINEGTVEPLMRKEHESKKAAEGEQGERKITKEGFKESKEIAGEKQTERDGKQEKSQRRPEKKQRVFDSLVEDVEKKNVLYRLQETLIEEIEDKSLLSREPEGITEKEPAIGSEEQTAALLQGMLLDYPELAPIITAMQDYTDEKQGIAEAAQNMKRLAEMDIQEAERELALYQRFWVIGQSEYKDWLILPPHDFNYEGEPITFDEPERENYNQCVYPNAFYRRIDRHPIQSGKEMGWDEIGVSVSILVDLINLYVLMWFKFTQAFWGWTGVEAVTGIVDAIHEYLTLETTIRKQEQKDVLEEYERAYQWLRWHAEQVVLSAREDRNLRGNYYVEVLLEQLVQYMLDHHFDVMPIFRDVNKMDEWRALFGRKEEKDIKWVLEKVKGLRHKLLEAKQYQEE